MKQPSVVSRQSSTKRRRTGLMIIVVLFTLHCSLLTASAEDVRSKSAVVMEASTGRILYGKNPNLKLPPASTTKLMTAMIALDRLNPADTVTISERAASVSPVKANFRSGERVSVETLLNAALIKSANDAAFALAEAVAGSEDKFVELMNEKVIALGMSDSRFINSTGLPGEGQYTSAYDLARMLRQALKYPLVREIINTKANRISTENGRSIFLKNSNRLLWADETMLGGKTGYTRAAKHCFVCACEQGNTTVITALLGAPSRETLWIESEALMERGFAIMHGKEEPVMYFARSDYSSSVRPASYTVKTSVAKEIPHKQTHKKKAKKKTKARSAKYASKHKAKENSEAQVKGSGGVQG
jgi:D-alanyl-D-alanine carboxypeptidase (penicillin-binding protein 5/6)